MQFCALSACPVRFDNRQSVSPRFYVVLGSLRLSLGSGEVAGMPLPWVAFCGLAILPDRISAAAATSMWRLPSSSARASPLGPLMVSFRFSPPFPSCGFLFLVWREDAPNRCIGGAGATAPHACCACPVSATHQQSSLINPSWCQPGIMPNTIPALLIAVHVHEYLRGVSVVQGLPPWNMPARPPATALAGICAFGATAAARHKFDDVGAQPILHAGLQPPAQVREYLRGVSVVQGLPPRSVLAAKAPRTLPNCVPRWHFVFQSLASWLVPLARGLLALLFLALLRLLAWPWRFSTPLGRACRLPLSGVRPDVLRPLGLAVTCSPVLDWQPWRDRKAVQAQPTPSSLPFLALDNPVQLVGFALSDCARDLAWAWSRLGLYCWASHCLLR